MPTRHPDLSRAMWRKSTRSTAEGQNCVEVTTAAWRKSRRSSTTGQNCVEVATTPLGIVAVRDSKNPTGPALLVPPAEWRSFVAGLKTSQAL